MVLKSSFWITLVIAVISCISYFKIREVFWAAELSPYLFCALCYFFALITFLVSKNAIRVSTLDVLLIVFFTYSLTSSYIVNFPYPPSDAVYNVFGYSVFYIWIRASGLSQNSGSEILMGIICIATIQAIWGISQYIGLMPINDILYRIQGGFINPGLYGCFMAIGCIISLYLMWYYKNSKKVVLILVFAITLMVIALWLSQSRTAYVVAFLGICSLFVLKFKTIASAWISRCKILFLIVAACLSAIIMYYLWQNNPESVTGRFLIWKISLKMVSDHPAYGIGYGNFFVEYGNYQARYFMSGKDNPKEVIIAGMNYYPFNEFLSIAVESGIVGLSFFVALLFYTFKSALKKIKSDVGHTLVFAIILVSILIFGLFSYPFQNPAISCLFYLSIASISTNLDRRITFTFQKKFRYVLLVGASLILILSIQKIRALVSWAKAKEMILLAEGDALRTYQDIYPVLACNGAFLFNYGSELAEIGVHEKSLSILTRATLYGNSVELQSRLATVYVALHKFGMAEQHYLKAAAMDPKLFVPLYNLFMFYRQRRLSNKAEAIAWEIVDKEAKIPSVEVIEIKNLATRYLQETKNKSINLNP